MTTRLTHLAINADDLDAAQRFYAGVLGLRFAEYLGPEFRRTRLDDVIVALQRRRPIGDLRPNGPECTFAVKDARSRRARAGSRRPVADDADVDPAGGRADV